MCGINFCPASRSLVLSVLPACGSFRAERISTCLSKSRPPLLDARSLRSPEAARPACYRLRPRGVDPPPPAPRAGRLSGRSSGYLAVLSSPQRPNPLARRCAGGGGARTHRFLSGEAASVPCRAPLVVGLLPGCALLSVGSVPCRGGSFSTFPACVHSTSRGGGEGCAVSQTVGGVRWHQTTHASSSE